MNEHFYLYRYSSPFSIPKQSTFLPKHTTPKSQQFPSKDHKIKTFSDSQLNNIIEMKIFNKNILTVHPPQTQTLGYKNTDIFQRSEPDLYVILGCKIYPMHKTQILCCGLISSMVKCSGKVVMLQMDLQTGCFEDALAFLYGCQPIISRSKNLENMYETAKVLQIPQLLQIYHQDFNENFQEYEFFQLYKLAINNNISPIIKKCQQELLSFQFQQINFNRADLLELPIQLFQKIIKNHQKLKANKEICGISACEIREAIRNYEEYNKCKFQIGDLMQVDEYDCFQGEEDQKQQTRQIFRSEILLISKPLKKKIRKSFGSYQSTDRHSKKNRDEPRGKQFNSQTKLNTLDFLKDCDEEIDCCDFSEYGNHLSLDCAEVKVIQDERSMTKDIEMLSEELAQSSPIQKNTIKKPIIQNSLELQFLPQQAENSENYCITFNKMPIMQRNCYL